MIEVHIRHNLFGPLRETSNVYVAHSSIRFIIAEPWPTYVRSIRFMARAKTPGNGSTARKQVATMPAPKLVEVKKDFVRRRTWKRKSAFAHTNCTKQRGYTARSRERRLAGSGAGNSEPSTTASRALKFRLRTAWGQLPSAVQSSGARQLIRGNRIAELRSAGQPRRLSPRGGLSYRS